VVRNIVVDVVLSVDIVGKDNSDCACHNQHLAGYARERCLREQWQVRAGKR
jgi:hypothetical protein